ncbi:MAG: hypothetical protein JWN84_3463 [Nocardioides sp.]|nr:hypothetical protein [Nocardioides sp.]
MLRFLFVLVLFGVAVYFLVRMFQDRGMMPQRPTRPQRSAPPRVVGPDDDEDFLRDLDRKRLDPEDPEV